MKPLVFAGPSLHGLALAKPAAYDLAPPASCGDIMRAVLAGRTVIALIDGIFESGPSVWHKEILFALSAGCHVLGAASMGALRAAECWPFGMIGTGGVYEDYRIGRRSSDADVALLHGPAELSYRPLSVPLVDLDDCTNRMAAQKLITSATRWKLQQAARSIYYKVRNWEGLLTAVDIAENKQQILLDWIAASGPAAKARDALDLLETLTVPLSRAAAPIPFQHTRFSDQLLRSLESRAR